MITFEYCIMLHKRTLSRVRTMEGTFFMHAKFHLAFSFSAFITFFVYHFRSGPVRSVGQRMSVLLMLKRVQYNNAKSTISQLIFVKYVIKKSCKKSAINFVLISHHKFGIKWPYKKYFELFEANYKISIAGQTKAFQVCPTQLMYSSKNSYIELFSIRVY